MKAAIWVLTGLLLALSQSSCTFFPRFSYVVDSTLQRSVAPLPGLDGGPPREVAVVVGPDGARTEFVTNEIQVHLTDQAQLSALVARYHGTILRDGTPPVIPGGRPRGTPESSHDYLIRVDLANSSIDDLEDNMGAADVRGQHVFSSSDAVRLVALAARADASGSVTLVGSAFDPVDGDEPDPSWVGHPTSWVFWGLVRASPSRLPRARALARAAPLFML
jgi:hypothetical protein